ncbi:hypothetical protein [Streptomyces sp. NPDC059649]|uniref:hypothetical protein n=1 Tax=Streptomyces sp. NPDC059649 TaxID=3346895 RepID=UPI0036982B84
MTDDRRQRYADAIGDFMARECTICRSEYDAADAVIALADEEQREAKERYREGLRRADEHNNALMDEVQRYADGDERPVLWSVYNQMHLRAATAEGAIEWVRALHKHNEDAGYCDLCSGHGDITWPCATVRALDGTGQQ